MRVAVMQPYFFPYIGYFQLIASVDQFVLYDNIKYTKKGWINRNRMLQNGKEAVFSLPLKSASDSLDVCARELASDYSRDRLLGRICGAYRRAQFFEQTFPLIERIVRCDDINLYRYLHNSIVSICDFLSISTRILVSSDIAIDHDLKGQDRVLSLCSAVGANGYVNSIGGVGLYSKEEFGERGIELKFLRPKPFLYAQYDNDFVPWLSMVDVLMFNSIDVVRRCVTTNYELI